MLHFVVDNVDFVNVIKRVYYHVMGREIEASAYMVFDDHFELIFPLTKELSLIYQSLHSIVTTQQQTQHHDQIIPCLKTLLQQSSSTTKTIVVVLICNSNFVQQLHDIVVQYPFLYMEMVVALDMNHYLDSDLQLPQVQLENRRFNISRCLSSTQSMVQLIMERLSLLLPQDTLKLQCNIPIENGNRASFHCNVVCDLFFDCNSQQQPFQPIHHQNIIQCDIMGQINIDELNELYTVGNPIVLLHGHGVEWDSIIKNETILIGEVNYDFERREFLKWKNLVMLMPHGASDSILMKRFMTREDMKHVLSFSQHDSHATNTPPPLSIPTLSCQELPSCWKQFDTAMETMIKERNHSVTKAQPFKNRTPLLRKFK